MTLHESTANPYRAPESQDVPPPPRFGSRLRAARAGMRQGALLGAKWITCIMLVLAALVWIAKVGGGTYRLLRDGVSLSHVVDILRPIELLILIAKAVFLSVLMATLAGAVLGALGGAISYRKASDARKDINEPA